MSGSDGQHERPRRRRVERSPQPPATTSADDAAASATAGHIVRQAAPARAAASRSVCDAVCHSSRCRASRTSRQSVRTIASAETQAWCGRKATASATCCTLVAASCADGRVVGAPRLVERRPDEREQQRRRSTARRSRASPSTVQRSGEPGSTVHPATRKSELRDLDDAAPQVVEDLPAREQRQPVALGAVGPGHRGAQPVEELPVAADPAMLAPREGEVARRVVVVDHRCRWRDRRARSCPRSGRARAACSRGSGRAWPARTRRRRRCPCR